MAVTAKFYVSAVTKSSDMGGNSTGAQVVLNPVYGKENEPWSKYTPSGRIEMNITNPDALSQFELGKAYLLTFDPAP